MENRDEEKIKQNKPLHFNNDRDAVESAKIPVIEEKIKINKEVVESGRVRLTKRVQEEEQVVDIPSIHEEVEVERIAINKYVDTPPPPVRHEGDTTIISVLREVVVVEKRIELVEEVRITKQIVKTQNPQKVTLRKEEVDIKRINSEISDKGKI